MNLEEEYLEEGVPEKIALNSHFTHISDIGNNGKKFSVDNPYSDMCAEFANHQSAHQ